MSSDGEAQDTPGDHASSALGDGTLKGQDFEPGLGHTISLSTLTNVLIILLVLTGLTVTASRIDFGHWNMVIAILIASVKAAIVATYFMHLKFEGKTILMYVVYPLMVLFIFVGGSFMDVSERIKIHPAGIAENLPVGKIAGGHHEETNLGTEKPGEHNPAAQH